MDSGPLLHYLSAERDLATSRPEAAEHGGYLVIGAPRFGEGSGQMACLETKGPTFASRRPAAAFDPLPASLDEANEVAGMLTSSGFSHATMLVGPDATEAAFKRLAPGQRVIHLATHAFVAEGTEADLLPMSGLALAGANDGRCDGADADHDGILTADEIASEDLSAAEWVVLSACDTGSGPIQTGEGVLGLNRAFEIAGARTLVMSLWKVDDQATRQWMKRLYEARLRGSPWPEAMRQASLSVMADRKAAGLSVDPFYWGAFVATGDWK